MKVYTIIIIFIIKCDFIFAQDLNDKSFLDYQISSERYLADEKGNILMHVNVWGHIGNPGHHLVYDGIDLATLFSIVGGPKTGANLKNVKVIREVPDDNGQISYNINIENFMVSGDRKNFIEVKPNDTIIISQTFSSYLIERSNIINILLMLINLGVQIGNIYN